MACAGWWRADNATAHMWHATRWATQGVINCRRCCCWLLLPGQFIVCVLSLKYLQLQNLWLPHGQPKQHANQISPNSTVRKFIYSSLSLSLFSEISPYLDLALCPIRAEPWSCARQKTARVLDLWDDELQVQWQKLKGEWSVLLPVPRWKRC